MSTKRSLKLGAAVAALGLTVTGCGGAGDTGASENQLEVFSWWTSGSESKALQVLFKEFQSRSNAKVVNAAVAGGAGSNAEQVLQTRLIGGDPPDSWQLHPDEDLMAAVQDGTVADISAMYQENGWADVLPDNVVDMVSHNGKFYAVPVNAHRANVLWTNPEVLQEHNIEWDEQTTTEEFIADATRLDRAGVTPLCLGDKDIFAAAQLLETLIMAQVGADGWNQLMTGEMTFDDPAVRTAVEQYVSLLGMVNSDHSALTWDQAAIDLGQGECAANLMGDWAYGELVNKGFEENKDFGYVPMPGTADIFSFVGDAFVKPAENAPNPEAEAVWLSSLLDPQAQVDFNLAKGSAPVRTDVSLEQFPPYQQDAAADFRSKTIVSSLANSQAAPPEFAQAFADAVTALNGDKNVDSFMQTMVDAQGSMLG